jgi:hypothetical protein
MTEGFHRTEYGLDYVWLTSAHNVSLSRHAACALRWILLSCGSACSRGPFPEHCGSFAARVFLLGPKVDALSRAEAVCTIVGVVLNLGRFVMGERRVSRGASAFVFPARSALAAEPGPA